MPPETLRVIFSLKTCDLTALIDSKKKGKSSDVRREINGESTINNLAVKRWLVFVNYKSIKVFPRWSVKQGLILRDHQTLVLVSSMLLVLRTIASSSNPFNSPASYLRKILRRSVWPGAINSNSCSAWERMLKEHTRCGAMSQRSSILLLLCDVICGAVWCDVLVHHRSLSKWWWKEFAIKDTRRCCYAISH